MFLSIFIKYRTDSYINKIVVGPPIVTIEILSRKSPLSLLILLSYCYVIIFFYFIYFFFAVILCSRSTDGRRNRVMFTTTTTICRARGAYTERVGGAHWGGGGGAPPQPEPEPPPPPQCRQPVVLRRGSPRPS